MVDESASDVCLLTSQGVCVYVYVKVRVLVCQGVCACEYDCAIVCV